MQDTVLVEAVLVPLVAVVVVRFLLRWGFPGVHLITPRTKWTAAPVESRLLTALYLTGVISLSLGYVVVREVVG